MRYHILFISLFLILILSAQAQTVEFAGGTGRPDDPYQIATPAQLIAIGQDPNLQDKHFVLVSDIDMDPNLPDGQLLNSSLVLTTGSFDGAGHRILNLILRPYDVSSLFESVGPEATIKNVSLEKVTVSYFSRLPSKAMLVQTNEGTITDCSVEGHLVEGNFSVGGRGGLVAENYGLILNCSVAGIIEGENSGGLVGINSGIIMYSSSTAQMTGGSGLVGENSGAIVACWATGDVTEGSAGLVGDNSGTIRYCYAMGDVTTLSDFVGGLVGTNSGEISQSYATGDVKASGELAGGLVGTNSGEVLECYATGDVWAEDRAAGLAAINEGTITHCYATGSGGMALATTAYGDDDGIIQGCYALAERDGGGINNGIGIILTDAQMGKQECFIGWDFDGTDLDGSGDYWMMSEAGGYPTLKTIEWPDYVGAGTIDDPYLIETYPQFLVISREPRACYRLLNDIDLEGQTFWTPIIPVFWGHFDGDGYSVSNFSLTGEENLGVFGTLHSGAVVTDLTIHRASAMLIRQQSQPETGGVGILATRNQGCVTGCSVSAEITMLSGGIFGNIGGLVGVNETGEISKCSAYIAFSAPYMGSGGSLDNCGGLIGKNMGAVSQCHASSYGNVSFQHVGGLIGCNEGDITDSYADGYLEGSYGIRSSSVTYVPVGGLIGTNVGSTIRCYSATTVLVTPAGGTTSLFNGAGFIGENLGGPIEVSYFLAEADGGGVDNGFGTALSEVDMRQQGNFADWDFEGIWTICEGIDYPRLRWEGVVCGQ